MILTFTLRFNNLNQTNFYKQLRSPEMKNRIFLLALSMAFLIFFTGASSFAQEQQTRFLKQHNTHFLKDHLKQTEEMLVQALKSNSTNMSSSATQTIRELEQIFPSESFSSFIEPLSVIIKNEKADTQLRILSALALDGLHSDKGDKVIYEVAKNTTNESLKNISMALAIESYKADDKVSLK